MNSLLPQLIRHWLSIDKQKAINTKNFQNDNCEIIIYSALVINNMS